MDKQRKEDLMGFSAIFGLFGMMVLVNLIMAYM